MGNPHAPIENIEYLVQYTRASAVITIPDVAEKLRALVERPGSEVQAVFVVPDVATGQDPEQRIPALTGTSGAAMVCLQLKRSSESTQLLSRQMFKPACSQARCAARSGRSAPPSSERSVLARKWGEPLAA